LAGFDVNDLDPMVSVIRQLIKLLLNWEHSITTRFVRNNLHRYLFSWGTGNLFGSVRQPEI
jgi:hypothetical protein